MAGHTRYPHTRNAASGNPVCRPYRAKVATSDIRGSLAKLACNAISYEEDCELDKVRLSGEFDNRVAASGFVMPHPSHKVYSTVHV